MTVDEIKGTKANDILKYSISECADKVNVYTSKGTDTLWLYDLAVATDDREMGDYASVYVDSEDTLHANDLTIYFYNEDKYFYLVGGANLKHSVKKLKLGGSTYGALIESNVLDLYHPVNEMDEEDVSLDKKRNLIGVSTKISNTIDVEDWTGDDTATTTGQGIKITTGSENDLITATKFNDTIKAGKDDDLIYGCEGDDVIYGEQGNNIIRFKVGDGKDTICSTKGASDTLTMGKAGVEKETKLSDVLEYSKSGNDLVIKYQGNTDDSVTLKDFLKGTSSVKYLKLTDDNYSYSDTSTDSGDIMDKVVLTQSIDESNTAKTINGSIVKDKIYLNVAKTVKAGGNDDYVRGSNSNDKIYGENGNDTLVGYGGDDIIYGGKGNDLLAGAPSDDKIYGDDGDDTLLGGEGKDSIYGGNGNDIIYTKDESYMKGSDYYADITHIDDLQHDLSTSYFEKGEDEYIGDTLMVSFLGQNNSTLPATYVDSGKGNDTIIGTSASDIIYTRDGDDYIYSYCGADTIYAGKGNDTINTGANINTDITIGEENFDIYTCIQGAKIYGEDGDDNIDLMQTKTLPDGTSLDKIICDGGSGSDSISCEAIKNAYIYGGSGNDFIRSHGDNVATFDGGKGDDKYTVDRYNTDKIIIKDTSGKNNVNIDTGEIYFTVDIKSATDSTLAKKQSNNNLYITSNTIADFYLDGEQIQLEKDSITTESIQNYVVLDNYFSSNFVLQNDDELKINKESLLRVRQQIAEKMVEYNNTRGTEFTNSNEWMNYMINDNPGSGAIINDISIILNNVWDDCCYSSLTSPVITLNDNKDYLITATQLTTEINVKNGDDTISANETAEAEDPKWVTLTIKAGNGNNKLIAKNYKKYSATLGNGGNYVEIDDCNSVEIKAGNGVNNISVDSADKMTLSVGNGNNIVDVRWIDDLTLKTGNGNNVCEISGSAGNITCGSGNNTFLVDGISDDLIINSGNNKKAGNNYLYFFNNSTDKGQFNFGKGNDTMFSCAKDATLNGGNGNDLYFACCNGYGHEVQDVNTIINDTKGNDIVYGYTKEIGDLEFYFNVSLSNNKKTISATDLKITSSCTIEGEEEEEEDVDYTGITTIKNYFTSGKIESLRFEDESENVYTISSDDLNSLKQEIASWLTTTDYTSTDAIMNSGSTDLKNVLSGYYASANDYLIQDNNLYIANDFGS